MNGTHDRQETDEQMQLALRALHRARSSYRELADQLPAPLPGSMLDIERAHTAREPVDILVMAHRARASENLDRVFEMMFDAESDQVLAYPFSLYSLLRAAVEAAATAMWLVKSDRKADRVLRALQLSYRNSQEALRFAELIAGKEGATPARQGTAKTIERLNQLKDTVGPLRQVELGPPPRFTAILTAVSPQRRDNNRPGYDVSSPLVVWKVSSAFLHGSEQVVRALSDVRQMGEFTGGVASFEVTPSIQMLAISIRTCVELLSNLDARYVFLATHDYRKHPVGD